MNQRDSALKELQTVIETLLGPDGCSWDREQTPQSLCEYVIEETHELVDAIRRDSDLDVREELGDVFFLLLFLARLYSGKGAFSLDQALSDNAAKMIRRHPHVFAGEVFDSREEQLREWDRIKQREKQDADAPKRVFGSLPRSLPPLTLAYRIHAKAERAGFTWDKDEDVEMQAESEWLEFLDSLQSSDLPSQERELGDLIFTLVELGRRKGIKAASAVDGACRRFLSRFECMESLAAEKGQEFSKVSMEEKNALWETAKEMEKGSAISSQGVSD